MKKRDDFQALLDSIVKLQKEAKALVEESGKDRRSKGGGRAFSVAACVTEEEKAQIEQLCDEYSDAQGWRIRRGALLRLVWLHFLENHESIDLEPYRD